MKIELRIHLWPATPHLREVKIIIDGEVVRSAFLGKEGMFELSEKLSEWRGELFCTASQMEDE
jgi:hypothetical protein